MGLGLPSGVLGTVGCFFFFFFGVDIVDYELLVMVVSVNFLNRINERERINNVLYCKRW